MARAEPLVSLLQQWIGTFMRRSMGSMILFMKQNDLSMSQIGALFQIDRGRSNVSDLGDGLGISIAAASQMLERLVQQDLIQRSEDPRDRRSKQLILTEKGKRVLRESVQARQLWLEELASTLSVKEKEQVAAAVKILIDKNDQLNPPHLTGR